MIVNRSLNQNLGIEYTNIHERKCLKACGPYTEGIRFIHTSLLERLKVWNGSEPLDDYICEPMSNIRDKLSQQINEASVMVQNRLLENIREAELRLLFGCKVSSGIQIGIISLILKKFKSEYTGHKRENQFIETVISLSDAAMSEAGSNWRGRYYATDLDLVLATSLELDNKERREKRVVNQIKLLDTALALCDSNSLSSSPSSATSDSTSSFFGSISDFTDATSVHTDSTDWIQEPFSRSDNSQMDSLKTNTRLIPFPRLSSSKFPPNAPSTASPSELAAPIPQELPTSMGSMSKVDAIPSLPSRKSIDPEPCYCWICGKPFTGHDRISNRQRHITFSHGERDPSICPFPDCGRPFTRPDNMMKHYRTQHRLNPSAPYNITNGRRKSTES